jgi:hypothetical protein
MSATVAKYRAKERTADRTTRSWSPSTPTVDEALVEGALERLLSLSRRLPNR